MKPDDSGMKPDDSEPALPPGYRRVGGELEGNRRIVCHVPPGFDAVDALTVERWLMAEVRKRQGGMS